MRPNHGLNLNVVNYQNPGKTQEKIKPTLCYGHYEIDISHYGHHIMTLYYGHYDCMA